jgi:hypothetical protein
MDLAWRGDGRTAFGSLISFEGGAMKKALEVVSKPRITAEGKAQADSKAQHTRRYVSISRGLQRRHRASDGVMKPFLAGIGKVCTLLIVLCAGAAVGSAEAQKVEDMRTLVVFGSAPVQGSNVTAARDAAIAGSLMQAVVLSAMEILSPEGFAENFRKLNEQLLDRPDTYIQDFRVLSETVIAKQHRVVVQATVNAKQIGELLAGAGLAGERTAAAASQLALTVEGSGNLANFVKFRKALGGLSGVESVQVRDMKPNETTLLVAYKGAAQDLGAALMQQSFDAFTLAVAEAGEGALRVVLSPK